MSQDVRVRVSLSVRIDLWRNWIAHLITAQEVGGSNPSRSTFASVVELVVTPGLSLGDHCDRAGSTPVRGTKDSSVAQLDRAPFF